jgi:nitrogen fixation-related uncharacterized protein
MYPTWLSAVIAGTAVAFVGVLALLLWSFKTGELRDAEEPARETIRHKEH